MKKIFKLAILLGIYLLLLCTIGYANEAPTLGAGSDWYRTEIDKSTITQITLAKDYAKIGDEIVWNAGYDANPISCYLAGTELTIVGNEYGIKANADSSSLFANFTALTSINGLDILDTSEVTNMKSMFSGCNSLISINLDNFVTSEVTNMQYMFSNCYDLESLDVSKFDTSKVTNMQGMFCNSNTLQSLDVSNFDTNKVTTMEAMFSGCSNLLSLDVSNFDTTKVTTMYNMFKNCSQMTSIDVDNLVKSTSATTNIGSMFYGCSRLEEINVSSWDTSRINVMSYLFRDCSSLTKLDVSNFDTRNASDKNEKFYGCNNLIEITVGVNFSRDDFPDNTHYWYTANGTRYTYNTIPGNTARTYYAVDPSKKITITLGTGGSIAREDNIAISGDVVSVENTGSVALIVTSEDGYHLNTLIIDKDTESEEIKNIIDYKSMSYAFSNVTTNHTIEATFTECSGGTATCAAKALCTTCGSEYGETLDHTLGEYQTDGVSHWKECSECEYTTDKEDCSGGAATCTEKAVCTTCGNQYGEAAGHSLGDYQTDGTNHWKACSECSYTTEEEECSGGEATCTSQATCTTCGGAYGEVADHTLGEYQNDGTNHWKACSECSYTTGEEVCSGGVATCSNRAVCTTCGSKYGEVAEHSWDVIAQATCTTPETHMCTSCNEIINVGEALEHDYSGEITCNQNKTDDRKCIRCDSTKEIGCTHIYIVTFNTNGGFGSMNTQTFYNGVEQELTANTFSREGYKFVGWSITSSGNKKYSDGESCIFSSDTTLYAVWQILQYQMTGEAGEGGFVNPLVGTVNHGESKTFTITSSDNYHIATVFVDNEQIEVKDKKSMVYEFSDVAESHTIKATFEPCENTWLNDSEGHWSKCTVCGIEKVESKVTHTYEYKYDETKHWQVCKVCRYSSTEEVHKLDWEFDWETHRQECEMCEYKTESEQHILIWKERNGYHWQDCISMCGRGEVSRPHKYTFTSKDETTHTYTCSECSFVLNEEHVYDSYQKDETEHWQLCTKCGHVTQKANHTGGTATSTEKAVCETCGTIYGGFLYTVTFVPNGGSGWMEQFFPEGVEQSLSSNTFKRDGYDFLGWSSSSSGEVEYYEGAKLILTKDITIYAIWKRQVVNTPAGGGGGGGGSSEKEDEEEIEEYTINASAGKGGSISPSGNVKVKEGKNKTFKITPDKGYKISDVLIDGKSIGVVKSYTFTEVDDKHSIEVVFVNEQTETKPGDVIVVVGNKNNFKEVLFPAKQLLKINNLDGTVKCSDEVATLSIKKNIVRFNNGEAGISIGDKKVILTKPIKILKNEVYITLGDFMQLLEW